MSDALDAAMTQLGVVLGAMSGLTRWYSDPPEALAEFPCGMAFANYGSLAVQSDGLGKGLHTVSVVIYQSRAILPEAIDAAKVWPYRIFAALAGHLRLNSTVDTIVWPMAYKFGPLQYGSEVHYGVTCDITLKIMAAVTCAV